MGKNYLSQKSISSCISWAFFNKKIITSSSSSYFFLNMQVSKKNCRGSQLETYIWVRMITKYYDCKGPILVYLHKFPGGGLQIPILTWPLPQLDPRTHPTPTLVHVCLFFFFFTSGSTFAHCFRCREGNNGQQTTIPWRKGTVMMYEPVILFHNPLLLFQ